MQKRKLLYKKENSKIRCLACSHHCLIGQGQTGICGVRYNNGKTLELLTYARPASVAIDPVEKKPLFHFLPGSQIFSFGTVGCNLSCLFCQNWEISQYPKILKQKLSGENYASHIREIVEELEPEEIVKEAIKHGCPAIAATYTEPTIFFEYAYDVFKLAKKKGLKTVFVSNGYQSKESIELIKDVLDAINIDLKSMSNEFYSKICGAKLEPVLENIKRFYEEGVWVELTTLLIPGKNTSEAELTKAAKFVKSVSPEIPWHFSAFYPNYKMLDLPPTPISTVQKAWKLAKKEGIRFVYVGNVNDPEKESTYCPQCGQLLIKRNYYDVEIIELKNGKCSSCGEKIPGVW